MWKRFRRAMRSMFGWMISAAEDPEMILEQNIRDLNDQVPKMNESIAMVKANVTLLDKENQKYKNDSADLTAKVKAALQAGREDIATTYATQLQTLRGAMLRNEQQLSAARQAYDKAMQVKQAFMREKDRKTNDAMQALRDARRAKWQSKVADAMESFQVAGIDATHDEMLQKIQETTAVNEARMDMALSNVDTQGMKIEEEAEKIRAGELLKQFKQEMGLEGPAETGGGDKTIGKKVGVQ
ncbi:MAG TPA: PspA/IM30 family protein [Myxococcales bacterium]|jgi:phage shock protein A|nr:PspA/IM30 family protein [Myxococcales bacterium]